MGLQSGQLKAPAALTPKEVPRYSFLLEAEWTPRSTELRHLKISMEQGISRLVAQCLKQLCHRWPLMYKSSMTIAIQGHRIHYASTPEYYT